MDIETREILMEVNPAALAQYSKRERKRAAAQRQLESFMDYHNSQKRERPPEPERYVGIQEREFDARMAHAAQYERERQAAADSKRIENERLAAKHRAERAAEQMAIEKSIEENFVSEFMAAGDQWR